MTRFIIKLFNINIDILNYWHDDVHSTSCYHKVLTNISIEMGNIGHKFWPFILEHNFNPFPMNASLVIYVHWFHFGINFWNSFLIPSPRKWTFLKTVIFKWFLHLQDVFKELRRQDCNVRWLMLNYVSRNQCYTSPAYKISKINGLNSESGPQGYDPMQAMR